MKKHKVKKKTEKILTIILQIKATYYKTANNGTKITISISFSTSSVRDQNWILVTYIKTVNL